MPIRVEAEQPTGEHHEATQPLWSALEKVSTSTSVQEFRHSVAAILGALGLKFKSPEESAPKVDSELKTNT